MTDVITQPLPRAAALVAPGSHVVAGADAVLRLLPEYDRLARRCGLPLTAREAWITAQLDAEPTSRPWAVTVRAPDGALLAAAMLLDRSATSWGGVGEVVLAGGGD